MNQKKSMRVWVKVCIAVSIVCVALVVVKPTIHEYAIKRRYKQAILMREPEEVSLEVALRGNDPPVYALTALWDLAFDNASSELEVFTAKRYLAGTASGLNPLVFPGKYQVDDWNLAFERFLSEKESQLADLSQEERAFTAELRKLSQEK